MLQLRADERQTTRRRRICRAACYGFLGGLAALLSCGTAWLRSYFGLIEAEEITFVLATGGGNAAGEIRREVAIFVVLPVMAGILLGVLVGRWQSNVVWVGRQQNRTILAARWFRRGMAVAAAAVLVMSAQSFAQVVPVRDILFPSAPSRFIEENYVAPTRENVHFPEEERNLIHIVLESYENTFYDAAQGGGMDGNLLPDLGQIAEENVSFSHADHTGGFFQVPGATFTMGGITAQLSGVPLKTPMIDPANQLFTFPDFVTVGDLLVEQGYTTEVMMRANAGFATKRDFFTQHGDVQIFDHAYAMSKGYLPEDYLVWWGYEDDKLVDFVRSELTRLAA